MDDYNFLHRGTSSTGHTNHINIYVVEDDKTFGESVRYYLSKTLDSQIFHFTNSLDCLNHILAQEDQSRAFCLVTDISLDKGQDGLLLIDNLKEKQLSFVSLAMTGFASIENAISATKKGVYHYLTKPFELKDLKRLIIEAVASRLNVNIKDKSGQSSASSYNQRSLGSINSHVALRLPDKEDIFYDMIGRSKVMKDLFERIKKIASTDSTVMISGPSGTGKELVSLAIHKLSKRASNKLVSVNCGAIPGELLESELFGHVKGSFTGAISNRKGRFEEANQGSIFLDEIGDMPHHLQVKILRVLQSKTFEPVGSNETVKVDSRVIAATHRNLDKMVVDGTFREDLFYRLNVIPLKIPALRERREDIPLLMGHFSQKFVSADGSNCIRFTQEAMDLLLAYDWPGNVRELENIMERLVILKGGGEIRPDDLPAKILAVNPLITESYKYIFELPEKGVDLKQVLSDIEDSLILQALSYTDGNKNQASKLLRLNRTTLIEKIKKKAIEF